MKQIAVNVPEFRHRLHHSNTLEMFNAIEQRLANTSMEQLNIRQNRRTITYDGLVHDALKTIREYLSSVGFIISCRSLDVAKNECSLEKKI